MATDQNQQICIIASIISQYVLDNGIADGRDAEAVARRIYNTGFRLDSSDRTIEQRIGTIEQRISAIEGWCGLSRHMIFSG